MATFIVIGSGPTAVASSYALLKNNNKVIMLDYGNKFGVETIGLLKKVRENFNGQINKDIREQLKFDVKSEMPTKKMYNDDFVFQNSELFNIKATNFESTPSLALGGLSNIWGAGVLPYLEDIDDWPIGYSDLESSYKAIHDFMPLAAIEDDLLACYPILTKGFCKPKISEHGLQLMMKLNKNKSELNKNGVIFGYARTSYKSEECKPCSMCMYGCPIDLIYSSRHDIKKLLDNYNFNYVNEVFMTKFVDESSRVLVEYIDKSGSVQTLTGDKLIIAAGSISSTSIVMRSLDYRAPVLLKDNPYFMFPLIDFSLKGDLTLEKYNTMLQLFIKINDSNISEHSIHLGVYGYNDILEKYLKFKYGIFYKLSKPILNKIHLVQGFLHSDHCSDIVMQYDGHSYSINANKCNMDKEIKLIMRKLRKIGLMPTYIKSLPGRSYHLGGSMPMSKNQNGLSTDIYGKLNNTQNIHVVDASIFPTIPAQTITYTAMANAFRICNLL